MADISELTEFTQKAFKRITAKDPSELNEEEANFIRARSAYLSKDQMDKSSELFTVKSEEPKKTKTKSKK